MILWEDILEEVCKEYIISYTLFIVLVVYI